MRALILCLLALAAVACGGPERLDPRGDVYADESLPDAHRLGLQLAAEQWRAATRGRVDLTIHDGVGEMQVEIGEVEGFAVTFPRGRFAIVIDSITKRSTAENLVPLLMHEFGHAFGLESHARSGLMRADGADCIDEDTLRAFCSLWGCPRGFETTCLQ